MNEVNMYWDIHGKKQNTQLVQFANREASNISAGSSFEGDVLKQPKSSTIPRSGAGLKLL